jgi:hypothetical protein
MTFRLKAIFQRDDQYEGVRRINIYLLRLVFILMFFVLGKDTWTRILTHQGLWEPGDAVVWCVWAAFATLADSPAEGTILALSQRFKKRLVTTRHRGVRRCPWSPCSPPRSRR